MSGTLKGENTFTCHVTTNPRSGTFHMYFQIFLILSLTNNWSSHFHPSLNVPTTYLHIPCGSHLLLPYIASCTHSGHWGRIRPGKCLVYSPTRSKLSHIFLIGQSFENSSYYWSENTRKQVKYSDKEYGCTRQLIGSDIGIFLIIQKIFHLQSVLEYYYFSGHLPVWKMSHKFELVDL